jgi:fructose-1,6-bisphosphatase/inositol monophosphatase family enzyme
MKLNLDADLALAQRLADAAGAAIRPHFRSGLASERKRTPAPSPWPIAPPSKPCAPS